MKRERIEARGVTAAVIISTVAPSGDAALDNLIGRAEQSFFDGAEKLAAARRDEMMNMSARERRASRPTRVTLSSSVAGGKISRVTLTATLESRGARHEKSTTFFYDGATRLISKSAEKRKKKTSREKL